MQDERKSVRWYEVAYIAVLLAVLVLATTYLRAYRVGVVNLDAVFSRLGVEARLAAAEKARVQSELDTIMSLPEGRRLVAALESAKTDEEKSHAAAELQVFQNAHARELAQIEGGARRFRSDAVRTFRERIRPHLQKVAKGRRVDLILFSDNHEVMNPKVDLTDAVVESAKPDFTEDRELVDPALLKQSNTAAVPAAGRP